MSERMKPILAAVVTGIVVNYLGLTYFFGPIAANDAPSGPLVPPAASLIVVSILLMLLYDWVVQEMGHAMKGAITVAISQILLVDVFYLLNGQRGLAAAAASAVLLLGGWAVVGMAYGMLWDRGAEAVG
ncbi:MAG: hypothetical protein ACPHO4_00825 [Longimicrobiales bacterium]